jgi:hypothetical protein
MSNTIHAVEQSLNRFILSQTEDLDPIDDDLRTLIEAIALHIIRKEEGGEEQKPKSIVPMGYIPTKQFIEKCQWVNHACLWILRLKHPGADFYFTHKNRCYYHPKKTYEVLKNFSPHHSKKLRYLEKAGALHFDSVNN